MIWTISKDITPTLKLSNSLKFWVNNFRNISTFEREREKEKKEKKKERKLNTESSK